MKKLFLAILLVSVLFLGCGSGTTTTTPDLLASVTYSYSGRYFTIQNNDSFDWHGVKLTLNSDYRYNLPLIKANSECEISAREFARNDGTRFDAFTMKVLNIFISCKRDDGKSAYWNGVWK